MEDNLNISTEVEIPADTEQEQEYDFEVEIEGEEDTEALPTEEETETDLAEEQDDQGEDVEEQPKQVPLSALHEERNKRREIEKRLSEAEALLGRLKSEAGIRDNKELQQRMDDTIIRDFVENKGMDEPTAKMFLMYQRKIAELEKMNTTRNFDSELSSLKSNPFYADIEDVADDVKDYAAKKNLSMREAYNALYAESRIETLQRETEQKVLKNISTKQSKKIEALGGSNSKAPAKQKIKLSAAEAEIAKLAGITPAEYAKFKKE